jgi:hypothetical protein
VHRFEHKIILGAGLDFRDKVPASRSAPQAIGEQSRRIRWPITKVIVDVNRASLPRVPVASVEQRWVRSP